MHTDISLELATNPWFKIVDFLQQNWCVLLPKGNSVLAVFYGDTCGVFDEMEFSSWEDAKAALTRNGFSRFLDHPEAQDMFSLHRGDIHEAQHPNGRIYSSGKFWQ